MFQLSVLRKKNHSYGCIRKGSNFAAVSTVGTLKLKQKQTSLFCMPFSVWYKLLTSELSMFFLLHESYLQFRVLQLHQASYFSSITMSYILVVQTENSVLFSCNHIEITPPLFLHLCQISELIFFLNCEVKIWSASM